MNVLENKKREYGAERTATDFDLVNYVYERLISVGLVKNAEFFINNMGLNDAINKKPEVQRYILNKFFFTQLVTTSEPSFEERFCLVPDGSVQEWVDLFDKKILNFLIRNDLPRPL